MDAKRKLSQEEELCLNDGKRKKVVVIPENQGAGGSGTRSLSETESGVFMDVPVVSSNIDQNVFKRDHSAGSSLKHVATIGSGEGSSSGRGREGLANDLSLHENELFEVHIISDEEEIRKDKGKGKAIFDLNKDTMPKEETVSNTYEKHGEEVLKICEHFWIWKQGHGHVCWKCDINDKKHPLPPGFGANNINKMRLKVPEDGFSGTGILPHTWHKSCMKPHQVEILNFLCNNLAVENPNGCVLAQAPISEKTFLMVTFIYGYLAQHPGAKALFLLPKGMFECWKREFDRLEVNDIMMLDFYSSRATSRSQKLEILKEWLANRSILFLGHKQFSNMVNDKEVTQDSSECRDILLNQTSFVVFDRGTDPRNEMMSLLNVCAHIKTARKVLLSGTVYQNHIREVFNILEVLFPEFWRHNQLGNVTRRLLNVDGASSNLNIPLVNKLEEIILSQATPHGDKIGCLTELRMLTNKVIYYHKREHLLEDKSCLMDFTVVLNPTLSQRTAWEIEKNSKGKGFKTYSTLSGITLHPKLSVFSDRAKGLPDPSDDEMDELLKDMDVEDGVKTKFFLGLVKLCGHTNEKILVVSQYVNPLIFLQRLMAKNNGWKDGKETFMVKGESSFSARENSFKEFNNSPDAKVFFASVKSCSEDNILDGVTRVVLLDIIYFPCMVQQAIRMAYHSGQKKKVYCYRLVVADTTEEEQEMNAGTKEIVTGIWFEGKTYPLDGKLQIPIVKAKWVNDNFLGASYMSQDIKTVYQR